LSPILFSPDQRWLIISYRLSDYLAPFLFRWGQGLHYKGVKVDISEKVWRFVAKQYPIVLNPEFDHRYVEAVRWASNSGAFLVEAIRHSSTDIVEKMGQLDPWLCVFTIDGLGVSLDLSLMNRGALQRPPTSRSVKQPLGGPGK
jgi:hypothetical protein